MVDQSLLGDLRKEVNAQTTAASSSSSDSPVSRKPMESPRSGHPKECGN